MFDLTYDWWDGEWHMPPTVGAEQWTDPNGTVHDVQLWAIEGTLTLMDDGTYERVMILHGWAVVNGVNQVVIERPAKLCRVSIYAARPGVIIGKKGADIEKLRKQLGQMTQSDVSLNIVEIRKPEIDAKLVAQGVADQLERRIAFRRAMKRAVQSALRLGAEGIRITCAGRLGGAEIARTEWYREGRVPLHTLRAHVDYAEATAHTAYGVCGVKVWIFKGEILGHDPLSQDRLMMEAQTSGVRPARDDRR